MTVQLWDAILFKKFLLGIYKIINKLQKNS